MKDNFFRNKENREIGFISSKDLLSELECIDKELGFSGQALARYEKVCQEANTVFSAARYLLESDFVGFLDCFGSGNEFLKMESGYYYESDTPVQGIHGAYEDISITIPANYCSNSAVSLGVEISGKIFNPSSSDSASLPKEFVHVRILAPSGTSISANCLFGGLTTQLRAYGDELDCAVLESLAAKQLLTVFKTILKRKEVLSCFLTSENRQWGPSSLDRSEKYLSLFRKVAGNSP